MFLYLIKLRCTHYHVKVTSWLTYGVLALSTDCNEVNKDKNYKNKN